MLVFELIGCICLAMFLPSVFLPLQEWLAERKYWYDQSKYLPNEPVYLYIKPIPLIQCPKCLSFWLSLGTCLSHGLSFQSSVLISFISYAYTKRINS